LFPTKISSNLKIIYLEHTYHFVEQEMPILSLTFTLLKNILATKKPKFTKKIITYSKIRKLKNLKTSIIATKLSRIYSESAQILAL
jgi:hypothetical protein